LPVRAPARRAWASYLAGEGVRFVFFSAQDEADRIPAASGAPRQTRRALLEYESQLQRREQGQQQDQLDWAEDGGGEDGEGRGEGARGVEGAREDEGEAEEEGTSEEEIGGEQQETNTQADKQGRGATDMAERFVRWDWLTEGWGGGGRDPIWAV